MLKLLEDREKYFARLINIIYFFLNILLGIERNFYLLCIITSLLCIIIYKIDQRLFYLFFFHENILKIFELDT